MRAGYCAQPHGVRCRANRRSGQRVPFGRHQQGRHIPLRSEIRRHLWRDHGLCRPES